MNTIRLNPLDNVEIVNESGGAIPRGHKVATQELKTGDSIIKFGHSIGFATQDIHPGQHVHVHNVAMGKLQEGFDSHAVAAQSKNGNNLSTVKEKALFQGYLRPNGDVGIRNYVVVTSTVNCSATVVKAICRQFEGKDHAKLIDGVIPVTHTQGCAQEIGGEAYQLLNRTLAGWVYHPNVVGAVVIGLGCEGTTFKSITESAPKGASPIPIVHIGIQDSGGTAQTIKKGIEAVEQVLKDLPRFERSPQSMGKLKIALNCGGSDSFSSITANPILGLTSDLICHAGGTAALAEIPECLGTEDLLFSRAKSAAVKDKLKKTLLWWDAFVKRQGGSMNDNLAPGNIAGGISTILEKSLGSVTKAGTSQLNDVFDYAEKMNTPGFVLMNTPGYDPVSVTGLVAGGCQMVAFTTGRGSVFGAGIAPTIKISTTTDLYRRMSGDMDFNAGRALEGMTTEALSIELFDLMQAIASGQKTCSEKLGIGWEEFIPWNLGETY